MTARQLEKKIHQVLAAGQVKLVHGTYGKRFDADRACGCALFVAACAVSGVDPQDLVGQSEPLTPRLTDAVQMRDWLELEGVGREQINQLELGFEQHLSQQYDSSLGYVVQRDRWDQFYQLGRRLRSLAVPLPG